MHGAAPHTNSWLPAIQFAGLKVTLAANIAASVHLDKSRKRELHDAIVDMPHGDRLCHGDFHPLNILGDTLDPVVIDWLDARRGDPVADVCRSYLLLKLHAAEMPGPTSTHAQGSLKARQYRSRA